MCGDSKTREAPDSVLVDQILMGQKQQQRDDAWTELVCRYDSKLRMAVSILPVSLREDGASEAWLRVITKLDRFDGSLPFGPWIDRVALNVALRMYRKYARERRWRSADSCHRDIVDRTDDRTEHDREAVQASVREILKRVDSESEIGLLKTYVGFDCHTGHTAQAVGRSRRAVQKWLRRNRRYLQLLFQPCVTGEFR